MLPHDKNDIYKRQVISVAGEPGCREWRCVSSSGVTLYPNDGGKLRVELSVLEGANLAVRHCAVGADGRVGSTEQKLIFPEMIGVGWLALLESGDVVLAGREFDKAKNTMPGSMALRVYSPEGVLKPSGLAQVLMTPRKGVAMATASLWTTGERVRLISTLSRRIYKFDS